jgi:plasmid stabilization system protein ParE
MPYKIIYLEVARLNVVAAKVWYKTQQNGLQIRFAKAVKEAILRIQNHPEAYSIRYRNIRIAHPCHFPYSIHFYIDYDNNQIVITNILHNYREIEY